MNRAIPITKESDVRETPPELYAECNRRFRFDLDACATHENAKCPLYFTEDGMWAQPVHNGVWMPGEPGMMDDKDGLTGRWRGRRVWCNPPFSDLGAWCNKAWFSDADLVVMLVPSTRTEQPWWHEYVEPWRDGKAPADVIAPWRSFTTENLRGRVHFLENGQPILRKNRDGSLYIDPESGKTVVSSPKFGCSLLIWQR